MKFSSVFILAALGPLFALADTVSYDNTYDDASNSLNIVACSNGNHGLEVFGFTTFGSLPDFPYIGGVGAIEGFNSANCGTCWQLTYTNPKGVSKSINVLGIDHAAPGTFNIAQEAMDVLTGGQAVQLGRVTVKSKQVAASVCGLNV
ncbi:cerato-platanin-related secreted protein [Roridomyces roridus]|uniref:Cerato-platanin-related secreted protein n=1 Tax=Roridomyces roridus TaxID=1738132 RepID=A0AAD7CJ82_9AGAR|nr:cerato-platanin-related secreted protein [Roridomyces roridus]